MTPVPNDSDKTITRLFEKIDGIIQEAQQHVKTAVNLTMVYAYYEIGRNIFEEEQQGQIRAEYGAYLLESVSRELTAKYKRGYSADNLKLMRRIKLGKHCFPNSTTIPKHLPATVSS